MYSYQYCKLNCIKIVIPLLEYQLIRRMLGLLRRSLIPVPRPVHSTSLPPLPGEAAPPPCRGLRQPVAELNVAQWPVADLHVAQQPVAEIHVALHPVIETRGIGASR